MSKKYETVYSEDEARICLTCTAKKCRGTCERLRAEKRRLHEESLPPPLYETEELIIPDEPPWPKKNPYIKEKHTDDQGTAAKLPKN